MQTHDLDEPMGDFGPRVRQETVQHAVTEHIRSLVLQGAFAPGARIRQGDLAAELGVSTTPVREALRQLATEGLLDSHPHRGVCAHQTSRDELMDLYEMRMALEPIALKAVVERITPEETYAATVLISAMERETSVPRWAEMNSMFHKLVDKACRRPLLVATLAKLRDVSAIYIAGSIHKDPDRKHVAALEHRRLLAALVSRDLEAAQTQERAHLEHTLALGLAHIQATGTTPNAAKGEGTST